MAIESESFVGTKKWSEGAMWVGGVSPGIKDDAILTAGAGTVEVSTAVKVKSIDATNYKATLKLQEKVMTVGAELEGAGSVLKWGTEMSVLSVGIGAIELPGAKSCTPEITTNGSGTGRAYSLILKGSGIKVKLVDALIVGGFLEIKRCADFLTENNTIETGVFAAPGELATTLHLGKSLIKISNALFTLGEGVTLNASEATVEGVSGLTLEAAKNHTIGTVVAKKALTLEAVGEAPRSFTIGTLNLENGGNVLEAERTLSLTGSASVQTFNVTTITTNATEEAKRIVIKSSIAGKEAKLKKAAGVVELDYVEVKDNHAEGEVPFKALSHSVLGEGNTNWELVSGAAVAGTAKIKLQDSSAVTALLAAAATTKVTFKTTNAPATVYTAAGTTKVSFNTTNTLAAALTAAASTQVRFVDQLKVTVEGEAEEGRIIVMIFEDD